MCHLESCPLESTLDVEPFVRLAAVKNALVTAHLGCDEIEGLDKLEPELLALLVLRNGNVLDMADETQVVDAGMRLGNIHLQESGGTYNFLSTIKAPVPTILPWSSMTRRKYPPLPCVSIQSYLSFHCSSVISPTVVRTRKQSRKPRAKSPFSNARIVYDSGRDAAIVGDMRSAEKRPS